MWSLFVALLWLCRPHYGDTKGHGTETYKSEGRAKQEADYDAVEDLRDKCQQKDKDLEPGYIDHEEAVCSSATVDGETLWTCDVDVWSYCYKRTE